MSDGYVPSFQVTEEITNLTIEIGQYAGFTTAFEELHPNPVLRRENRIRSIHSSLAIEQNTLTLNQVSDVIDGKRVFGPPQDIREVKNAYEVYDAVSSFDPYSVKDLLRAHQIMMEGLVREAGVFRSGNGSVCRNSAYSRWNASKVCARADETAVFMAEEVKISFAD